MTVKVSKGPVAEFWRSPPPIVNSFKADANLEVYTADRATEGDHYFVPFTETTASSAAWISPSQSMLCDALSCARRWRDESLLSPAPVTACTVNSLFR